MADCLTYDELADALIPYVVGLGFTHIELMPVSEYPHDPSWGYQPIGLFAPTSRFGTPAGFARFVDRCHRAGLGVLLDWVPAHFPIDPHGLALFDGTALYEHADPRQGLHPDWTTAIFDFGRPEVVDYLIANALFWLDRYHVDGFRVDAVASMLHLDYSRKEGEWVPNRHGGNQNLEAVAFLRKFNEEVYARYPGVITIAEESTTWPGVSHPDAQRRPGLRLQVEHGMDARHARVPARSAGNRRKRHDSVTFGITYAFAENFVLALSHDEVVHGKLSLLGKMNGDTWQQFATLRAFYAFMWAYPGKKLLFMGQEFAQEREWDFEAGLRLAVARHSRSTAACRRVVRDCNHGYRAHPGAARRRLRRRGIPLDRRRRCAPLGLCLAAPRRGRRAARRRRRQFHADAASRLPHRLAAAWSLARDPQHRFGAVRRIECRQCRGGRGAARCLATAIRFRRKSPCRR